MNIRLFQSSDTDQVAQLFHDTIRSVNLSDYTEEQVKAWAPDDIHFRDWEAKCSSKYTLVAKTDKNIAGFAILDDDGCIDCFFCHKDLQRQGIGKLLYNSIEKEARNRDLNKLFLDASITARPFFHRMGFSVIKQQTAITKEVKLTNFQMEKIL